MSDSSDNDENDEPVGNNVDVKKVSKKQAEPAAQIIPNTEKADAEIAEILDALLLELPEVNFQSKEGLCIKFQTVPIRPEFPQ